MRTILFLIQKEFLQVFRDRALLFMLIAPPIVQLIIITSAATFDVKHIDVHLIDLDRTPVSLRLVGRFESSGRFKVTQTTPSGGVADRNLLANEVDLVLRIPNGFGEDLVRGRRADLQLIFDGTDGPTAGISLSYSRQTIERFVADERSRLYPVTRATASSEPRLDVRTRMWYNPGREFEDYMAPGILVILITIIGTMITALNIAREKEQGTIEQLNVTPITKGQFITGKLVPFWLLGIAEFAAGLCVAWLIYDIPLEGSLLLVFAGAALYLVSALGLGLLISTVSHTQQQAQFIAFFVLMIYLFISGLFTPVESMPEWARWIAEANPIKHIIALIRAVLIKGAGVPQVATELGALAVFAAIVLPLAVRTYSKTAA